VNPATSRESEKVDQKEEVDREIRLRENSQTVQPRRKLIEKTGKKAKTGKRKRREEEGKRNFTVKRAKIEEGKNHARSERGNQTKCARTLSKKKTTNLMTLGRRRTT